MNFHLRNFSKVFVRLLSCILHKLNVARCDMMTILNENTIHALSDAKCSTVLMIADVTILAFTALLTWTLINMISLLLPYASLTLMDKTSFCIVTAIPSLMINYFILWRKDKYLEYFEVFRKSSQKQNRIWSLISMACLLLALMSFILSLSIM